MTNIYLDKYNYSKYFKCYHVGEIGSTNTFLKNTQAMLSDHVVLIADTQTNGRGRFEHVWQTNDDICFSILFKNHYTNQIIAPLALELAFIRLGFIPAIKWPNDIYFAEKKLAGILIEDIFEEQFSASIIGIGINMHSKDNFNAIGINDIKPLKKEEIISSVLNTYEEILSWPNDKLMEEYKKYSMVIGRIIEYKDHSYKALDITKEGFLIVEDNGVIKAICSNEITLHNAKIK